MCPFIYCVYLHVSLFHLCHILILDTDKCMHQWQYFYTEHADHRGASSLVGTTAAAPLPVFQWCFGAAAERDEVEDVFVVGQYGCDSHLICVSATASVSNQVSITHKKSCQYKDFELVLYYCDINMFVSTALVYSWPMAEGLSHFNQGDSE